MEMVIVPIPADDQTLKRIALEIAAQMPDNEADALRVLDHVKTLVRSFLAAGGPSSAV